MPALRSPIRSPFKRALRAPFDYSGVAAAAPTPPGSPVAWHTMYDRTYMTVNSDGSGGQPAIGGTVGRVTDRTGNGWHIINATTANQPRAQAGYLSISYGSGAGDRQFLQTASAGFGGTTQSCTGLLIVDAAQLPTDMIPFTFSGGTESAAAWPIRRVALVYRGSPTALDFWINGVQYTRAAIASVALTALNIGTSAATPANHRREYESILYNTTLSDPTVASLIAYGAARAGSGAVGSNVLLAVGDSRTVGYGTVVSGTWPQVTDRLPTYRFYKDAAGGRQAAQAVASGISTIAQKYFSSGTNKVVIWLGNNDQALGGATPAVAAASVATLCGMYKSLGARVIVCTETYWNSSVSNANVDAFNAIVIANWTTYADAVAVLMSRTNLQNPANTTYFYDGIHPTDAANVDVNIVISAAADSIDADFTQSALAVVAGQSISFTDTTENSPSAWSWDVDGGGVDSTAQNPTLTFSTPGTFSPTLTATNSNGSTTRTKSSNIIVTSALSMPTSNLVLFFDKGNASGATWTDTSGLARDMTLFNSPTIAGGRVTFNGTTQYGKTATYATNKPVFMMMKARLVAWTGNAALMDGDTSLQWLVYMNGSTPNISWYTPAGSIMLTNGGFVVGTAGTLYVGNRNDGVRVVMKINNTETLAYQAQQVGMTGLTVARQGAAAARFANIEVTAIAGFSVVPSDAQIAQAKAYMDSL